MVSEPENYILVMGGKVVDICRSRASSSVFNKLRRSAESGSYSPQPVRACGVQSFPDFPDRYHEEEGRDGATIRLIPSPVFGTVQQLHSPRFPFTARWSTSGAVCQRSHGVQRAISNSPTWLLTAAIAVCFSNKAEICTLESHITANLTVGPTQEYSKFVPSRSGSIEIPGELFVPR